MKHVPTFAAKPPQIGQKQLAVRTSLGALQMNKFSNNGNQNSKNIVSGHQDSNSESHTQQNGHDYQSKHIYYSSAIKNLNRNNGKKNGGGGKFGGGNFGGGKFGGGGNRHQTAFIDRKAWKKSLMD